MRAGLLKKFIDVGFKVNIIDARFIGNTAYSFSSDTVKKMAAALPMWAMH
jgi:hypothetical protein